MIRIFNDRMVIEIQEPGSGYKRARFDWSGICQQIRLDGEHIFCSQEATANAPGTEGIGLTDEFGIHTPIGYDQIEAGSWFPKIGIGFLQKVNNDPYNFFYDYNIQPVPFQYEQDRNDQLSFLQESEILNGWGWRLRKTLSLDGAGLAIDYALENRGEKAIVTEQYNHNFIAINGETVGPGYQLNTSFPLDLTVINGGVQVDHQNFNLTEVPPTFIYVMQPDCGGLENTEWRLIHQPSGHGLQVSELFPLQKFALWGMSHVISPEFFVWIDLEPGQTQTWQRKYTFF
jgi:hypothetical protein